MDSGEVRSSIEGIYNRFLVPKNLRRHMYSVASVAELLCDSIDSSVVINKDNIIAACLLHDVGNIVKIDLCCESTAGMLVKEEAENLSYWTKVKESTMAKYGRVDHEATHNMLEELEVDKDIIHILNGTGDLFDGNGAIKINESNICNYADLRVSPKGVLSVTERTMDFCDRCKKSSSEVLRARGIAVGASLERILEMERLLFAGARITPEGINDKSIKPYLDKYIKR